MEHDMVHFPGQDSYTILTSLFGNPAPHPIAFPQTSKT